MSPSTHRFSGQNFRKDPGRISGTHTALRFVYLALALVLRNVWVTLRFAYCQLLRRGRAGRSVNPLPFKLRRLAAFLQQAIEHRYGLVSQITAHALPLNLESVVH